ncbi:MAG: Nif3-like dinuclear metal center hexameric protein [Clostridia bacterium]|nr:Nif3-like dinuclear metal center hexameric protein [Clostridia bacterium]
MTDCKKLFEKLNAYAPIQLSYEMINRGHHDNSGIILDCENSTDKILFCLDLTKKSVEFAVKNGCGIIVTHHPAIYRPIYNLKGDDVVLTCAKNNISVISTHLNLDCAKEGIDHYLAKGLGAKEIEILDSLGDGVGYGRIFAVDTTAEKVYEDYKRIFKTDKVLLYGKKDEKITKIASFCGAGLDYPEIASAINGGAQMVVSADISHHVLLHAIESGLIVLNCSHYSSENYGMKKVAEYFGKTLNEKIFFFDDERFF